MKLKSSFDIIDVAGEYLAVPIGADADSFSGVVALSETAAYLLKQMRTAKTTEELVSILTERYDISKDDAAKEISTAIDTFLHLDIIEE